jgi:hypothetical protein
MLGAGTEPVAVHYQPVFYFIQKLRISYSRLRKGLMLKLAIAILMTVFAAVVGLLSAAASAFSALFVLGIASINAVRASLD